eukprot:2654832-Pyramimonas_sp.AAC.1
MPQVSEAEVEEAKRLLQDADERHRANSNMLYWLKCNEQRDGYDAKNGKDKKEFFLRWVAWSTKEKKSKSSSSRTVTNEKQSKD